MACAPTKTYDVSIKNVLEQLQRVLCKTYLPGCQHARGEKGEGEVGSKNNDVVGAYGQDTLNNNGERLSIFAANHVLVLVNTFFSTCKCNTSRTLNCPGHKKRIDILTRQLEPKVNFSPYIRLWHRGRPCQIPRLLCSQAPVEDSAAPDPDIGREVDVAVAKYLREIPPDGNSVNEAEVKFTVATCGLQNS